MARGWHYTKLSLSSALLLSFSDMCFVLLFLSFCRFCLVFVFVFMPTLELCKFSPNRFLSSRSATYRIGNHVYHILGMVEARSVNVMNTHTQ